MIKVSVVIPVYNGGKDLRQCVKSVLCQTLRELEVICVDDGSTDSSAQILCGLQAEDARVRILRQKNQGAGAARNRAMSQARGKYIAFLDADDFYLDAEALAVMVQTAETKNLPVCGSLRKRMKGGAVEEEELFAGAVTGKLLNYRDHQLDYNYQSFLFLKRWLVEKEINFPDYRRFQDPPFLVKALYAAGSFMIADTYLYCYRWSDMGPRFDVQKVNDLLQGIMDNLRFASERNLSVLFQNTLRRLEDEYVDIICRNMSSDNFSVWKNLIRANQMACDYLGEPDYVIEPLRVLLFGIRQDSYRKKLLRMIGKQDEIALYGAGRYGRLFLDFLRKSGLHRKVANFIVSDLQENDSHIEGIPVLGVKDCCPKPPVFITVRAGLKKEVEKTLDENGYTGYVVIREEFLHIIAAEVNEACTTATT